MSQHRSLRATATLGGKRNVLKRYERVEVLKKRGEWKAGDRITGLRKTKKEVKTRADRGLRDEQPPLPGLICWSARRTRPPALRWCDCRNSWRKRA